MCAGIFGCFNVQRKDIRVASLLARERYQQHNLHHVYVAHVALPYMTLFFK